MTYGHVSEIYIMRGRSKSDRLSAFVNFEIAEEARTCYAAMRTGYVIRPGHDQIVVQWPHTRH